MFIRSLNISRINHFLVVLFIISLLPMTASAQRELPVAFLNFDALFGSTSGDIFAAEGFSRSRVFKIMPDGNTQIVADGLQGPIDIAEDTQGNLYVTNFLNATVSRITPEGDISEFAEVLPFPAGIVSDSAGNFYVSHFGESDPVTGFGMGNTILKISPEGDVEVFSEGGLLSAPVGIAIDGDDNIYTGNFHDGIIIKIDQDAQQSFIADVTGPEVSFAIGHIEFANNRIFATGIQNQALFRVNPRNGNIRTRDISERVSFPNGITLNPTNNSLLIAAGFNTNASLFRVNLRKSQH